MTLPLLPDVPALLDDRFPLPLDRPFTTRQADCAGVTRHRLAHLHQRGLVRRLFKGVHVAAQARDSPELRKQALALAAPPGSVVCDWSACWLWTGIGVPGGHLTVPPLSVFRLRGLERLRTDLVRSGQRSFLLDDVAPLDGRLFITTPLRTCWDLGRFAPAVSALGGMDALARGCSVRVQELLEGLPRFRRQRGVVQLRSLAPLVDPRAESPGESALRYRWVSAGLPTPDLQIPVGVNGWDLFRIDLGLPALRYGAEYDGEAWHGQQQQAADTSRRSRLESEFGWQVRVFRRQDVFGPTAAAGARLLQDIWALTRGRSLPGLDVQP